MFQQTDGGICGEQYTFYIRTLLHLQFFIRNLKKQMDINFNISPKTSIIVTRIISSQSHSCALNNCTILGLILQFLGFTFFHTEQFLDYKQGMNSCRDYSRSFKSETIYYQIRSTSTWSTRFVLSALSFKSKFCVGSELNYTEISTTTIIHRTSLFSKFTAKSNQDNRIRSTFCNF